MSDLADRIIAHYERHASDWDADRRRSGWNDKPWHDRFAALLRKRARVLDFGCGGGMPIASNLVAKGMRVTGVDPAEYRELLALYGFELIEHLAEDPRAGGRTVWLARAAPA